MRQRDRADYRWKSSDRIVGVMAWIACAVMLTVTCSSTAFAQGAGTISGVVRDSNGGVLPGVSVEASSPALIEKVRSVTTDGEGRYRIDLLPDGVYSVKFSLSSFSTTLRRDVPVSANVTSQVSTELKVGGLTETITVSGEVPVVDVERANQVRALTAELFEVIPSGKSYSNMAVLIPAINFAGGRQDVGGADIHAEQDFISAHGSRAGDTTLLLDGMKIGNMISTGDRSSVQQSPLIFEQVNVLFSGNLGEAGSAAPQINSIIKSGGNTFRSTVYVDGSGPRLQSSNLTDEIVALSPAGAVASSRIYKLLDINGSTSGPLKRDRIWYFANVRWFQNGQYVPNLFYLRNPGEVIPVSDPSRQAYDDANTRDVAVRLTIAGGPKHKFSVFYDNQEKCNCHFFQNANRAPEATTRSIFPVNLLQATWTYTATDRLLFEAGFSPSITPWTTPPRPENGDIPPITLNGYTYRNSPIGGFNGIDNELRQISYRASGSYITGSHSIKLGWDMMNGVSQVDTVDLIGGGVAYTFINGASGPVPSQVTIQAPLNPGPRNHLNHNMGFFAQDQWTFKRMTATGSVRVDFQRESVDAVTIGPSKWAPNRNLSFPALEGVPEWKDVNPRFGVAYDLFGNGKTAVKFSGSRGVQQETVTTIGQVSPSGNFLFTSTSAARTWNDSFYGPGDPRTGNFLPDCNLADLTTTFGYQNGECGPITNPNFALGNSSVNTTLSTWDPDRVSGWNHRPYDWEFSGSVQHQLMPRVSLNVGYFRRISGNFTVQDNVNVTADNFHQFKVVVPNDPRLPGAGTQELTVRNVNAVIVANNFSTLTDKLDLKEIQHWNGYDINVDARLPGTLLLQGGVSSGKTTTDNCQTTTALPEVGTTAPLEFCHNTTPFRTNYKGLASYTLPWWDIRFSAAYQNLPGAPITGTVTYSLTAPQGGPNNLPSINAQLIAQRGTGFVGGAGNTVNIGVIRGTSFFQDRLNQLDLKVAKVLRMNRRALQLYMDVFNVFNSSTILSQNNIYGSATIVSPQGTWLSPQNILQPRFAKFGARFDF